MMKSTAESTFLQAFEGTNKTVPVWFMRQAGRYLPEYQAIRKKHSLNEMFQNPEIVAEVTCLPINILNVDAAILFADILTLPAQIGFDVSFDKNSGPVIGNPINASRDIANIRVFEGLPNQQKAIGLINQQLPADIPLIGFAGSPFTVLCYLREGKSSTTFMKSLSFIHSNPTEFHAAMKVLTENTIRYLNFQKECGIKVFQLFDTWAGLLRFEDYRDFVLPYVQDIFTRVDLPSIYYVKNCAHLLSLMDLTAAQVLSVCQTVSLKDNPILSKTDKGVQGNFFTGLLYAEDDVVEKEVLTLLSHAEQFDKYIFNLSHGVLPDVDVRTLKRIVDIVHRHQRSKVL